MKWSNKGRTDYYAACDFLRTFWVALTVAIAIAILIALLVLCLVPRNATAGDIVNFRTATRQAPAILRSDYATTRESVPVAELLCTVTAYSPTVDQTDSNPLITASGKRVYVGGVASDWSVLPCGSIVIIPNYNNGDPCTIVDTGGAIKGNKLDVFMWSTDAAIHFGRRRNVKVQVLYVPKAKS